LTRNFTFFATVGLFYAILIPSLLFAQNQDQGEAHLPSRVTSGIGQSNLGNFVELQYRPYSHDILNRDTGYVPFTEASKFNASFRYYQDTKRLEISKFSIFKMISLVPHQSFLEPKSYALDIGLESVTVKKKEENLKFGKEESARITPLNFDTLFGYTVNGIRSSPLNFSVLAGAKMQVHPFFNEFIRLGPQVAVNVIYDFGRVKLQFLSAYQYYTFYKNNNDYSSSIRIRYAIETNHELRLEFSRMRNDQEIALNYHFMF
jgi:hypothetical protein